MTGLEGLLHSHKGGGSAEPTQVQVQGKSLTKAKVADLAFERTVTLMSHTQTMNSAPTMVLRHALEAVLAMPLQEGRMGPFVRSFRKPSDTVFWQEPKDWNVQTALNSENASFVRK